MVFYSMAFELKVYHLGPLIRPFRCVNCAIFACYLDNERAVSRIREKENNVKAITSRKCFFKTDRYLVKKLPLRKDLLISFFYLTRFTFIFRCFLMAHSLFFILFEQFLQNKKCRHERESNSEHQSRRRAC